MGWQEAGENCIMRSSIIVPSTKMIKSRRMRWVGHVVHMEDIKNACSILIGKPERRPLRRCRWEDNFLMDLREVSFQGVHWIHLAQDRDWWGAVVNTVMNFRVS
jgi:hypothetical protein